MLSVKLSQIYDHRAILDKITLKFEPQSSTAILGPNGGGKSTLLKLCAGVMKPSNGYVKLKKDVKRAYLAQHVPQDRNFPLSVEDVAAMGFWSEVGLIKPLSTHFKKKLYDALEMVGLRGFEKEPIHILSGGQFQRLMFARLWLQSADLLILDEPFSAIDQPTTEDLLRLLKQWNKEGKTIITVIHQLNLAKKFFENTILLNKKVIAKGDSQSVLSDDTLIRQAYTE